MASRSHASLAASLTCLEMISQPSCLQLLLHFHFTPLPLGFSLKLENSVNTTPQCPLPGFKCLLYTHIIVTPHIHLVKQVFIISQFTDEEMEVQGSRMKYRLSCTHISLCNPHTELWLCIFLSLSLSLTPWGQRHVFFSLVSTLPGSVLHTP